MTHRVRSLVGGLSCLIVLACQVVSPARSEAAGFTVGIDNKLANGAGVGSMVTGFSPDVPTVGIRNTHQFWTTVVVQSPSGPIVLEPAALNQDAGGLYAALGVVGPGAQAVWTVKESAAQPGSQSVVITPGGTSLKFLSLSLNILTVALTMLGASAVVASPDSVVDAVTLAGTIPDFNDAVQAMQEQDIVSFTQAFYKILTDPAKEHILLQVFAKLGVVASQTAVQRLLVIGSIIELGRMAFDEARVLIDGTANGVITFTTTPPQTRVITFVPSADIPGPAYSGACWISSVVTSSNPNAWRCNGKDGIDDPCFGASPNATFVVCDADPARNVPGYKLSLSTPLPARLPASSGDPWIIQLTDGTSCTFSEGAPAMIAATKEFVRNRCSDGSSLINIRPGTPWTADKVVLVRVPGGGFAIGSSVAVMIATVWR